ncbi:3-oxoadipate enol-lactonase [Anaerolineales bacterium]|nr:3-oxoadipate enol-lactonase [Anaerolineales bacterium]
MPTLNISASVRLHYLDENPDGQPTVLALHGLGATGESWRLQIPALTNVGLRVLAPDARGFGQSTYPGKLSIAEMAADMARLIEALKVAPVSVVGISMGGTLALQLALDCPHLVSKLVLVNTFAHLRIQGLSQYAYYVLRFILVHTLGIPTQARTVTKRIFPHPDQESLRQELYAQIIQANPSAYRAALRALARFDATHRLGTLNVPTLVVTGDADTTVRPENQFNLAAGIRGAQHVIIPGGGHAVTAEKPAEFNRMLIEFLGV